MTEDISEFVKAEETKYTFYDKNAKVITENVELACAYVATLKNSDTYYIKILRGMLFDPQGIDGDKIKSIATKFSKVEKNTFNFYIDYLKTKESNYYTWAERSNIDV